MAQDSKERKKKQKRKKLCKSISYIEYIYINRDYYISSYTPTVKFYE